MTNTTLITGWNGFLGSVFCSKLDALHGNLVRCGRVSGSDITADLSKSVPAINCDLNRVIHVAGVTPGPNRPINTPDVFTIGNVRGTSNLLAGLTSNKPKSFVLISSASVYGRIAGELIDESAPLLATSEYAKSKRESEYLVSEWCEKHGVALTIVRLPLIVGNGASGALGQLIKAIRKNRFVLPGQGDAKKSMVLATDVVDWLVENPSVKGTFNLTDGIDSSYVELCDVITRHFELNKVRHVPLSVMKTAALIGDAGAFLLKRPLPYGSLTHTQLTESLTFSTEAASRFGWSPRSVLANTTDWLN